MLVTDFEPCAILNLDVFGSGHRPVGRSLEVGCRGVLMRMFTRGLFTGFLVGPLIAAGIAVSGFWPVIGTADPPL